MEGTPETVPSKEKPPIEIDDATPADARNIQNVFYKAWLRTYPNEEAGVTVDDIEDRFKDSFSEERIQRLQNRIHWSPPNERFLVARVAGKAVAACRVIRNEDKNDLQAIYILPEYQGQGIGRQLWNEGKTFFDDTKDTFVEVAAYNQNAIDFYTKLGFEDTGKRFVDEKFRLKSGATIPQMEMRIHGRINP